METLNVNEAALANIIGEIMRMRNKKCAHKYGENLAAAIFGKAREANDASVKELLGLDPL